MNVFGHEKPGLVVTANVAQLEVLLTLLQNNQLADPERALRLAGANIFSAFHNFSTPHIQQAVDEAKVKKVANATLSAFDGTKEEYEAKRVPAVHITIAPPAAPAPATVPPVHINLHEDKTN